MAILSFVIATTVDGVKKYISHCQHTSMGGRKYIPNYTTSLQDALHFEGKGPAEDFVQKLRNPLERVFVVEPIPVAITIKAGSDEAY